MQLTGTSQEKGDIKLKRGIYPSQEKVAYTSKEKGAYTPKQKGDIHLTGEG